MVKKIEDIKLNRPPSVIKNVDQNAFWSKKPEINKIDEFSEGGTHIPIKIKSKSFSGKFVFIIITILLLMTGGYFTANHFKNATVVLKEKHQSFTLDNQKFTATKDADNSINFEISINPTTESRDITLSDSANVSQKAKGSVTLYNEYSTKSQNLIATTRVEDSSGKLYLLDKNVSLPGYKKDSAGKIIPGTVVANVTSFLPGEEYNNTSTDFIISAYKKTSKEKTLYAKLHTPIAGGANGLVYRLTDKEKKQLNEYAEISLKENSIEKVKALTPEGYVLYPDAYVYSYKIDDNVLSKVPNTKVDMTATISSVIFQENDLTKHIIKNLLPNIEEKELSEIKIKDLSKLSFSFDKKDQSITKETQSVTFTLSGEIEAIWSPDKDKLKYKLSGIDKHMVNEIFSDESGIDSVNVKLFPIWQTFMPEDIKKINIKTE
jgi:hypothetical protein